MISGFSSHPLLEPSLNHLIVQSNGYPWVLTSHHLTLPSLDSSLQCHSPGSTPRATPLQTPALRLSHQCFYWGCVLSCGFFWVQAYALGADSHSAPPCSSAPLTCPIGTSSPTQPALLFFFFFFEFELRASFLLAKLALSHLNRASSPFCSAYFGGGALMNYLSRLALIHDLPNLSLPSS
jgi:hypothetical protein